MLTGARLARGRCLRVNERYSRLRELLDERLGLDPSSETHMRNLRLLSQVLSRQPGLSFPPATPLNLDFTKSLAAVTALTAAVVALSQATGAFDAMQRNDPQWSAAAFSAAVLAGILIVVAGAVSEPSWLEWLLAGFAAAAFLFACVTALVFLIMVRGDRPAPSMLAALKPGPPLSVVGSIKSSQLRSDESLEVAVVGTPPSDEGVREDRLLDARLGPNSSGEVEFPIEVSVPGGKYKWVAVWAWVGGKPNECFPDSAGDTDRTPGCIIMRVP